MRNAYLLLNVKPMSLTYALAFLLALMSISNTMLSPAANPQVDGSAVPVAVPVCHTPAPEPGATETALPQAVRPVVLLLLNTLYETAALPPDDPLLDIAFIDVWPDENCLNVDGS